VGIVVIFIFRAFFISRTAYCYLSHPPKTFCLQIFVDKYSNSTFVSSSKVLKLELCLKMSHLNIKLIDIALGQMKESLNEHVKVLDEAINRLELKGSWLLTSEQQKVRQSLIQLRNKMRDEGQAVPEVIVKREESRYVSLKLEI